MPSRIAVPAPVIGHTGGLSIPELTDPWDSLDVLEEHEAEPDFVSRWRGFLRDCSLLLLPSLPPEAAEWVTAADEFDAGRLNAEGLLGVRVLAWKFHDSRRNTSPVAELDGLRTVMYRLWPPDAVWWYESARYFLQALNAAGVCEDRWWPLLRARFIRILGGPPETVSHTAPDTAR